MRLKTKIEEPFTVAGTVSNKILIFDIDDTLIYSNATINVKYFFLFKYKFIYQT